MRLGELPATGGEGEGEKEREKGGGEVKRKTLKKRREANAVQVSTEDWIVCIV